MSVGVVLALVVVVVVALGAALYGRASRLGRKPPQAIASADVSLRLDAFWSWWRTAAPRFAAAIDGYQPDSIAEELSANVHAIDPRLAWETAPGLKGARHSLALSAEGDIELRILTERWLSRAPPPDRSWEYYAARQPDPSKGDFSLRLPDEGGVTIDFASVRVAFEEESARELIHVTFHHPAFAKLDEEQRARAAILVLDHLLGEDGVERWLGGINTPLEPLQDGKPLEVLANAVEALSRAATGERFAIADWKAHDGHAVVATINLALKRLDHLLMDEHMVVTIPLHDPTAQGLTTNAEASVLNALEHELTDLLGHDAVYIGRETGASKRTIHFHAARAGPAELRARTWAKEHPERAIEIAVAHDPRWEVLQRWR